MPGQQSRVDRFFNRLKNNRLIAALIAVGIIIIALSSFTNATQNLINHLKAWIPGDEVTLTLRDKPMMLSGNDVRAMMARYNFYEKNLNPSGGGIENRYETRVLSDSVIVVDDATQLSWQKSGSAIMITYAQAFEYVENSNAEKLAGFDDWRLPTLEEAMSLMEAKSENGTYIAPDFDRRINNIWTSDSAADGQIWTLYFYDGEIGLESRDFNTWVRLVR